MKSKLPKNLVKYRVNLPDYEQVADDSIQGAFVIPYANAELRIVSSNGAGWDHVSVSVAGRCPTWDEMHWIRKLFFEPNETVIQIDPPEHDYVSFHRHTLHMWRNQRQVIDLPPKWMIAPIKDQIPRLNQYAR